MNPIISYLKGLGGLLSLFFIGLAVLILYVVYGSIYALVVGALLILAAILVPYYLGKKTTTKPGSYELKKVK